LTDLIAYVEKFLINAGLTVAHARVQPFALIAQNQNIMVFVAPVPDGDLDSAVASVMTHLTGPFRAKSFGPKTMEMYAIFVASRPIALESIKQCEHNTQVCRKIVVTSQEEIDSALFFLKPLAELTSLPLGIEKEFWDELAKHLDVRQIRFLRELGRRPLEVHEAATHLRQVER
jgi:hypothetical protein